MKTEYENGSVKSTPMAFRHDITLDGEILHPSYYRKELDVIKTAMPSDQCFITVCSEGGNLNTGIAMVDAIGESQAMSVGMLRGIAHSCGSIIFLACQEHDVGIASEMLIHSGSGGTYGTPTQSKQRSEAYTKTVEKLFKTVYGGFLTEEELRLVIEEDKEYIFDTDEINVRLENMYEYRKALHEEGDKGNEEVDLTKG